MLDLILTNEEGVIQNLAYRPGLGDSDHVSLTFDLTCHSDQNERTQSKPNYFKANYGKIRGILRNVDWEDILAARSLIAMDCLWKHCIVLWKEMYRNECHEPKSKMFI